MSVHLLCREIVVDCWVKHEATTSFEYATALGRISLKSVTLLSPLFFFLSHHRVSSFLDVILADSAGSPAATLVFKRDWGSGVSGSPLAHRCVPRFRISDLLHGILATNEHVTLTPPP